MPTWGLSQQQRRARPWGLSEDLLRPAKQVTDPIHGDIYLTKLEALIADSPAMQRLRRLRQLGTTHLVYPGATHTRFAHSLGALRVAQDLMDALLSHRSGPKPERDLFSMWEAEAPDEFERRVAEAVVLARLGGLMHDMCHVAYGHTLEDDLGLLKKHDENMSRFEHLWAQLGLEVTDNLKEIKNDLVPLIISKGTKTEDQNLKYRFVQDVVGDTICADLLDYLVRDHRFTGLPMDYGDRFLSSFYVTPSDHNYCPERVAVRLHHSKRTRVDIETELFKLLRYRYELTERVLAHHTKLAADAMLGKMFTELSADPNHEGEQLELLARDHSDDGLLEHIAKMGKRQNVHTARKRAGRIAQLLLDRKLLKPLCSAGPSACSPWDVHGKFGSPAQRQNLESAAAAYAGIDPIQIAIWISHPDMRLKVAGVLVDLDGVIKPLATHGESSLRQGQEIMESHKRLWTISVFVGPQVSADQQKCDVLKAYLSNRLGVAWNGSESHPTVEQLAREQVMRDLDLKPSQMDSAVTDAAARGGTTETYADLVGRIRTAATLQNSQ